MKKVFLVLTAMVLLFGSTSCEPETVSETNDIYANDKDEEPDH